MRKDILNVINQMEGVKNLINKSELARRMGCSYNTVKKYIENTKKDENTRQYTSKLDRFKGIIIDKVDNYSANAVGIYNFIKDKGYTGSYSTVARFIKEYKREEQRKATIRFETSPGLQAQVDWKEDFKIINRNGEKFVVNIFLMVLGYSRYKYIELTIDRKQDTLFECILHACNAFGGVPHEVLFDNMSTVVDRSSSTYRTVIINKKFAQFAKDVGFAVHTCRPYRPQTKGKVECVAKTMDRLKVYNKEFDTIEELDQIVKKLMLEINNEDINFVEKPINRLKEEQKYLLPMPSLEIVSPYLAKNKKYKVSKESMISYKKHKYSVPIKYIGKYLTVKEHDKSLYIYYNTDLIVSYEISKKFLNYKKEHAKKILKLDKMVTYLPNYLESIKDKDISIVDVLYNLTEQEIAYRDERASKIQIAVAGFPFEKEVKDFDFSYQPGINKQQILDLETLRFIENNENILFVGSSGVGKTHLATSIGIAAAKKRYSTYFITCHDLILNLRKAYIENRLEQRIKQFCKYSVLIIDEIRIFTSRQRWSKFIFSVNSQKI